MKFHVAARLSSQRTGDLGERRIEEILLVVKDPFVLLLFYTDCPTRHVYNPTFGFTYEVEGPDDPGTCLFRTLHERVEPTGRDQCVIVQKNDILGMYLAQTEVACLVWR